MGIFKINSSQKCQRSLKKGLRANEIDKYRPMNNNFNHKNSLSINTDSINHISTDISSVKSQISPLPSISPTNSLFEEKFKKKLLNEFENYKDIANNHRKAVHLKNLNCPLPVYEEFKRNSPIYTRINKSII